MLDAAVTLLSSGRIFISIGFFGRNARPLFYQSKSRSTEVNRLFYAWTALIAARPKRALTAI
jgi:hypothetical protein